MRLVKRMTPSRRLAVLIAVAWLQLLLSACRAQVPTGQPEANTVPANTVPANTVPANTVPANTVPANTVPANTVPANTVPANTVQTDTVTFKDIEEAVAQVDLSKDLDDTAKSQIKEIYTQAKTELETAAKRAQEAAQFKSWIDTADQDVKAAEREKREPVRGFDVSNLENSDLNSVAQAHANLEQQVADTQRELSTALAEPQRRMNRKAVIADSLATLKPQLQEANSALSAATTGAADGTSPTLQRARSTLLRARRQALAAAITALETEQQAYDAQGNLPRLKIDLATTRYNQLEKDLDQLGVLLNQRRRQDAQIQHEVAQEEWQAAPEPLKSYAKQNIDLVARRQKLAGEIRTADTDRGAISGQLKIWKDDLARMRERTKTAPSEALGRLLVEKLDTLPSRTDLQREIALREKLVREFEGELFHFEERRAELADIDLAVRTALSELRRSDVTLPGDADAILKKIMTSEKQIVDSLLDDATPYHTTLISAWQDEQDLAKVVQEYRDFITERVLWVRSTDAFQLADLQHARDAAVWLARREPYRAAQRTSDRPSFNASVSGVGDGLGFGDFVYVLAAAASPTSRKWRGGFAHRLSQHRPDVASLVLFGATRASLGVFGLGDQLELERNDGSVGECNGLCPFDHCSGTAAD